MMTYSEAVDYLYSQLPMFQRIGAAAYKKDIINTRRLCDHFGHSYTQYPTIHIAGTNGKGSTSHMLASVLQEAGMKVGLYTSPHLKTFTERIRVNGSAISETFIAGFVEANKDFFSSFDPSFFEITVAMAFEYFAHEKVDVAVIETGLGGRLDSTNIITPVLSVITNIGRDHMQLLGNTLPEIAAEKAGIIKDGVPVVIGERHPETESIFERTAAGKNAPCTWAEDQWKVQQYGYVQEGDRQYLQMQIRSGSEEKTLQTELLGHYQLKNIVTVMAAVSVLQKNGWKIGEAAVREGIKNVWRNTGLKGRWQILGNSPLVIADVGHNKEGMQMVLKQLETYRYKQLRMVLGFVNDKEIGEILRMLPQEARYYFTKAAIPRAMDEQEVKMQAESYGLFGDAYPSVEEAFNAAIGDSGPEDLVFVGGSTFIVAEVV